MSDPVRLSESTMHFWPLFHARDDQIKPVENIRERYGVGAVERTEASPSPRGINRNYHDSSLPRQRARSEGAKPRTEYRSKRIPKPLVITETGEHVDIYAW